MYVSHTLGIGIRLKKALILAITGHQQNMEVVNIVSNRNALS